MLVCQRKKGKGEGRGDSEGLARERLREREKEIEHITHTHRMHQQPNVYTHKQAHTLFCSHKIEALSNCLFLKFLITKQQQPQQKHKKQKQKTKKSVLRQTKLLLRVIPKTCSWRMDSQKKKKERKLQVHKFLLLLQLIIIFLMLHKCPLCFIKVPFAS